MLLLSSYGTYLHFTMDDAYIQKSRARMFIFMEIEEINILKRNQRYIRNFCPLFPEQHHCGHSKYLHYFVQIALIDIYSYLVV